MKKMPGEGSHEVNKNLVLALTPEKAAKIKEIQSNYEIIIY